jgi:hypothetical protein
MKDNKMTSTLKRIYFCPWGKEEEDALYNAKSYVSSRGSGIKKIIDSVISILGGKSNLIDETMNLAKRSTPVTIDAIVNAANVELRFGSGVSSMCYAAIGKDDTKQQKLYKIKKQFCDAFKKYIKQKNDDTLQASSIATVAEKTGTFVLVVHHSGKDSKKGARGHSSLRAAVDTELEVKAEGETQILKVTKSRDGLTGKEYAYKREVIVVGTDADLEDVTSCVAISIDSSSIVSRKKKPSGRWQELACGALQKLGGVALKTAVLEEVGNIVQHKNRWRDSASRGIQACIDVGIFDSNGDQLKFS